MFGEGSVFGGVFLDDGDEAVGVVLDCRGDGFVTLLTGWVVARRGVRADVLEEGEGGVVDCERTLIIPLVESVVELFCCGEGGEIPESNC